MNNAELEQDNILTQLARIREVCDTLIDCTYTAESSHDELEELLVSQEVVQSNLFEAYAELWQIWHRREGSRITDTERSEPR
tara:strand:- start:151 stop:396 length:246 start_codon:yes stop_codon:yes gene_type:complete